MDQHSTVFDNLPFGLMEENEFMGLINDLQLNSCFSVNKFTLTDLNQMKFNQFQDDNDKFQVSVDPSHNFLSSIQDDIQCDYYFDVSSIYQSKDINQTNSFSICSHNLNSLPKNFESFVDEIVNFDVVGVCESKLTESIEELYIIPDYKMFTNSNSNTRQSGGLVMYVKDKFVNILERNDLKFKNKFIETLFIEIEIDARSIICGLIYHRPNSSKPEFIQNLNSILDMISVENKKIYIFGDFNMNLFCYDSNNYVRDFVDSFHSNNLINLIDKPTRVSNTSATLLDQIWTNDYNSCINSGIVHNNISDHFPVFAAFTYNLSSIQSDKFFEYEYRDFSLNNKNGFKEDLLNVDWTLIFNSNNPNVSYDNFITIFLALFNKNFPILKKRVSRNNLNKQYVTNELKILIEEKHKF